MPFLHRSIAGALAWQAAPQVVHQGAQRQDRIVRQLAGHQGLSQALHAAAVPHARAGVVTEHPPRSRQESWQSGRKLHGARQAVVWQQVHVSKVEASANTFVNWQGGLQKS